MYLILTLIIDTKVANLPEIVLTVYKEAEDKEGVKAAFNSPIPKRE